MIRFFESHTSSSTPDLQCEFKLSLQKNCHSTWHLASNTNAKTEINIENVVFEEKQQLGHVEKSNLRPLLERVVGENEQDLGTILKCYSLCSPFKILLYGFFLMKMKCIF